jgi:FkbM family methyltransferase
MNIVRTDKVCQAQKNIRQKHQLLAMLSTFIKKQQLIIVLFRRSGMSFLKKLMVCLSLTTVLLASYNEDNIRELIRLYIPNNPIILEAGAHFGEDTMRMKAIWPDCIVHAFEPHPDNYRRLIDATYRVPGVFCYQLALSDIIGTVKFYRCRLHEGASSLLKSAPFKQALYNDQEPINVQCLTLDEWACQNNVDHIDFCWLDMEGAELKMLQHASTILPTIRAIYIEVNFQEFRTGMVQYKDIKHFLHTHGFKQIWMTPGKIGLPAEEQANVLFVREDIMIQPRS